ncbi:MAG: recombinase RecA [Pirellulaceae bacterium]|nr:recombinase RecA [Pirellulaceae bacterium]
MTPIHRQTTGVPGLDEQLGGGLLPGTLTVVVGATGIGKTQLGLQFARAGLAQADELRSGVIFDVSARGDSQNHRDYARRMFDWPLHSVAGQDRVDLSDFFAPDRRHGDYLHVFDYRGRRVTRRDLEWEDWREWQAELNAKLASAIAFLYGNFIRGARRVVFDGIEPADRPQESIQVNLLEYVYHQIVRKDPQWVARDLFRQHYREQAEAAAAHDYDPQRIGCLLLSTSHDAMLDELISRPLDEGDSLTNANTLIYMGKIREGHRLRRALYIAKHRGSHCSEEIHPYTIDDQGLRLE